MKIGHLTPFALSCPCSDIGRDISIRVQFSNHCYTKSCDPELHEQHEIVATDGKDRHRVFCPNRYELSHGLRELIQELPTKKVHQTSKARNYLYVVPLEIGDNPYDIYFMQRMMYANDDLRLTVESSYCRDGKLNSRNRPNSIRFPVLAYKVLKNQPIRFASR